MTFTRTTFTPPYSLNGEWIVTRQEYCDEWLLIESRECFSSEVEAWKFYNDQVWPALADRLKEESVNI